MNTITISIEDRDMMDVIRKMMTAIKGVSVLSASTESEECLKQDDVAQVPHAKYHISPRIKAMEQGGTLPQDLSDDYKKEIGDIRAQRYL